MNIKIHIISGLTVIAILFALITFHGINLHNKTISAEYELLVGQEIIIIYNYLGREVAEGKIIAVIDNYIAFRFDNKYIRDRAILFNDIIGYKLKEK